MTSSVLLRRPIFLITFFLVIAGLFYFIRINGFNQFVYSPGRQISDISITFWPNLFYLKESVNKFGELPLWRVSLFSGSPFDVDPQSGIWYLPNVLVLIFGPTLGLNLLIWLHLSLAGIGMWHWVKSSGRSEYAAIFSGIAFAFTPKIYAHLGFGHIGLVYGAAYIPWVLYGYMMVRRAQFKYAAVLGLSSGLQAVANPQLAFYTHLIGLGYFLFQYKREWKRERSIHDLRMVGLILVEGLIIGVLTSAPQWVPMLRYANMSGRSSMGFTDTAVSSLSPQYLWGYIFAYHNGFMDYVVYIGIVTLLISLVSMLEKQTFGWWMGIVITWVYSLGTYTPLYKALFKIIPLIAWLRAPSRIIFLTNALVIYLAAFGFDRMEKPWKRSTLYILRLLAFSLGTGIILYAVGYYFMYSRLEYSLVFSALFLSITLVVVMAGMSKKLRAQSVSIVLLCLLLADLLIMDTTLIDGRLPGDVFSDLPNHIVNILENGDEQFRTYSADYAITQVDSVRNDLEFASGVDPLYLQSYDQYMQLASGITRRQYSVTVPVMGGEVLDASQGPVGRLDMLGWLNVRYIASLTPIENTNLKLIAKDQRTYLYENDYFRPRAFIVGLTIPVANQEEAFKALADEQPLQSAYVEAGKLLNSSAIGTVAITRYEPNHIMMDVALDDEGFLVISQNYYRDWQANVDNQSKQLYRVNGTLSGIYLSPGKHLVTMDYKPPYLIPSIISFAIGLGLSIFLITFGKIRRS